MTFHTRWAATVLFVVALGVSSVASAALVDRGGGMIYDTDLNITWLADANYALTSGYDTNGVMNWSDAMTWASNLSYGGYTDWRLPTSDSCTSWNCTGSEMGHLFYTELEGIAGSSITAIHNSNYNLFQHFQSSAGYWSSTESDTLNAWAFSFSNGYQSVAGKDNEEFALAVRSGDVSAVPVPAAVWLFGSGLIGLIGVARRKARA